MDECDASDDFAIEPQPQAPLMSDNQILTANGDLAYRGSGNVLVDLFYELREGTGNHRMRAVLENAWAEDSNAALRIIWNARSIHLGKADRDGFYRAMAWLAEKHPKTMLENLPWLVRPVIRKKAPKRCSEGPAGDSKQIVAANKKEDVSMVDAPDSDDEYQLVDEKAESQGGATTLTKVKLTDEGGLSEYDVKYGCAHGYWKDLLNMLALAANDEFKVEGVMKKVLKVDNRATKKRLRDWTEGRGNDIVKERRQKAAEKLEKDEFYRTLRSTVTQLFVDQLKLDTARLASDSKADRKRITLAAKWAPSADGMHDNHTLIADAIAELLHPINTLAAVDPTLDPNDRKRYLKHARIAYQSKTLSPLRKFLRVVERDITAEHFENILYDRVPSLAMQRYTELFIRKDQERFEQYIDCVAAGKVRISGAVLLPSTLVAEVLHPLEVYGKAKSTHALVNQRVAEKEAELRNKAIDGQWKSLVQRIKDSGTLDSSIAVCDVSGSMFYPTFPDGTCPLDSAIGLSLLLAEVVAPPFGGALITFSATPELIRVGGASDTRTFAEKIAAIRAAPWGYNTNFVAVFEKLLLPMALTHAVKKEDMVKQVFVFSDMQFDHAQSTHAEFRGVAERWSTSYARIRAKFAEAGYDMPRLIFWNLAGGRVVYDSVSNGEDTGTKPVEAEEQGTALVSGYSQGQMKMFLDGGGAEEMDEEETEEREDEEGNVILEQVGGRQDGVAVVRKAIAHEAYRMLKVVD